MNPPKVIGLKSAEEHVEILLENHKNFFSTPFVSNFDNTSDALQELWNAKFVVVSHDIAADPIFNFGNQAALNLFEMNFSQLTTLPSRKSAGKLSQTSRDKLLEEVTNNGCINNYTGVRISSTRKRFFIKDAKVWNLYDKNLRVLWPGSNVRIMEVSLKNWVTNYD